MRTEDQAKTCWCPFARVVAVTSNGSVVGATHNRITGTPAGKLEEVKSPAMAACIASACMAWRGESAGDVAARLASARPTRAPEPGEMADAGKARGYCGLAGSTHA